MCVSLCAITQKLDSFPRVTKTLQGPRTNPLIKEIIVSTTSEINGQASVWLWTPYKVSATANANMFLLRGEVYTMEHRGHAILYKDSGAPSGGPTLFQQRRGGGRVRQRHHWLSFGPETSSHFCASLSSHSLTKQRAARVSDMLCLSGHLDVHLVGRGVNLSILAPDGLALITARLVCHNHELQAATFAGTFERLSEKKKKRPLSRWVPLNEMLIKGRREDQEDQKGKLITLHSCFQVSTSQFCPLPSFLSRYTRL